MKTTSLTDLAREQLEAARGASSGRASVTVFGGHEHDLRQTVIALAGGRSLGEHDATRRREPAGARRHGPARRPVTRCGRAARATTS